MADADGKPGAAGQAQKARPGQLAADPVRRRLCRHGVRPAPPRRGTARGGRRGPGTAGAAAGRGENPRGPHRRGLRLPQLHHPPDAQAGNLEALRLHRAIPEGHPGRQGQGIGHDVQGNPEHGTRDAHSGHQPGPGRVGELLPSRSVQSRLRRGRPPRVAPHHALATAQAQIRALRHRHARTTPALLRTRHLAVRMQRGQVHRRVRRAGHPLPLPRQHHPDPVGTPAGDSTQLNPAGKTRGAPGAVRAARRVRRAGRGNPPGAILAGRPGPTPTKVYESAGKKADGLVNLYCWAHIRRYFVRAGDADPARLTYWTAAWLERIKGLYAAHEELTAAWNGAAAPASRDKTAAAARLEDARAAWDTVITVIGETRKRQMAAPGLAGPAKKALATLDREWDGLAAHRDYPMIGLDNNAAERMIRGPVVTRKNAGGSRNGDTARNAVVIWTATATAQMAGLNILTWLTAYLGECGRNGGKPPSGSALEQFLPWHASPGDLRAWAQPPAPG